MIAQAPAGDRRPEIWRPGRPFLPAIPGSRAQGGRGGSAPSAWLDLAGRGINLFKGLQQNFRAILSRHGGGRALAALMLSSDAKRRISKQGPDPTAPLRPMGDRKSSRSTATTSMT